MYTLLRLAFGDASRQWRLASTLPKSATGGDLGGTLKSRALDQVVEA